MSLEETLRSYWDADAATYDRSPGHRPRSPAELAAWSAALARLLPPPPARVLDCGAGTGFLSILAAQMGHKVTALDISPGMLDRLRSKAAAAGVGVELVEAPATCPPAGPFDAVMERHLLWTLEDPVAALRAWREVAPSGRLVVFEGVWGGDPLEELRQRGRRLLRRLRREPGDHHAEYPAEAAAAAPLSRGTRPAEVVQAVADSGWPDPWLERLRDVEWAALQSLPLPERLLGVAPRYVVTAG